MNVEDYVAAIGPIPLGRLAILLLQRLHDNGVLSSNDVYDLLNEAQGGDR